MPQQIAVMNQDLDSVYREQIKLSISLQTSHRRPGPHHLKSDSLKDLIEENFQNRHNRIS